MPQAALRTLLTELIDYAGLFPPAALPLAEVAHNYASYRRSPDAWALGRLVVPADRLPELSALVPRGERWPVSALLGDDLDAGLRAVQSNNASAGRAVDVDVAEARLATPADIARVAAALGDEVTLYAELPRARAAELLPAVRAAGARAKIRTGGVTADVFPSAADVARFIAECVRAGVPFKATAGLHHPVRGPHPLTYAPDAPEGVMHGFLNVFLAAAFAARGMDEGTLASLLDDGDVSHFAFGDEGAAWNGHRASLDQLRRMRAHTAIAFGSCSFREPLDDLTALGLL